MSRTKKNKPGGHRRWEEGGKKGQAPGKPKNHGKLSKRGGKGGGGGGNRSFEDNRVSFQDVVKKNERFERFYNTLNVVPDGPEREAFWASVRRELPNSFRFTGSKGHALSVRDNLVTRFFPLIAEIKHQGQPVEVPKPIPWYPEGLAYSMTTPKNVVRKYEPFKDFQKFLVSETGVGNISRQEQVSMIPPLLLDVRPEHTVLDLCAAPGSKSAQLIEAIHTGEEERVKRALSGVKVETTSNGGGSNDSLMQDGGRTTGLLVANDVNYQRAQMLVHQVKRLNSPNMLVTNHDATLYPSIELPSADPTPGQTRIRKYLKFDRILADVPCSGDGTTRKNPSIWKDWTPQNGLGLYITQTRILTRSLQLLKVGGKVVYSTCSMNPVENEAVVSSAIERCGGVAKVRLLDCSDQLPGLLRKPGLEDWSIMARDGRIYESFAEAEQYEAEGSKVVPGMFAPEPEEQIPLRNCMRVYHHQQDTGGFFIAVLEKLSDIRAKPETESKSSKRDWTFQPNDEAVAKSSNEPGSMVGQLIDEIENPKPPATSEGEMTSAAARQNKQEGESDFDASTGAKRKAEEDKSSPTKRIKVEDAIPTYTKPTPVAIPGEPAPTQPSASTTSRPRARNGPTEESFKYLPADHPELTSICTFYGLHPSFPLDRFLVRNPAGDPVKGVYYSSQLVKDILTTNEGRGMKFVHGGVKMFMKQDVQGQEGVCRWRIQTEGLDIIEGWVGEARTVRLTKRDTLRKLLVEMFPKIGGPDVADGTGWKALGEIGEQVLNIGMGCCVLRVQGGGDEASGGFKEGFVLPLWRSLHSLNLMLPKEDRRAMLLRLFGEDVELVNHAEDASGKGKGRASRNAEAEAKEVQRKVGEMGEEEDESGGVAINGDEEEALATVAADVDAEEEEDQERALDAEVEEDEDIKVKDAMPEREGEGDETNTTV